MRKRFVTGSLICCSAERCFAEDALSWCDKLASTPAVGVGFTPHYISSNDLLNALTSLLDKWNDGTKATFTLDSISPFGFEVSTEEGFH